MRLVAAVAEELGTMPGAVLGVGVVRAGCAAARMLAVDPPRAVVLLGTAGAFPGGPAIGAVIVASRLGLGSAAEALGLGYVPLGPGPLEADAALGARFGVPALPVLTNLAVTRDPHLASRFGGDWQVEHMEAYAVAWACAQAGVPFAAVLGITNGVGPDAHAEWLEHRLALQDRVQALVRDVLGQALGPTGR